MLEKESSFEEEGKKEPRKSLWENFDKGIEWRKNKISQYEEELTKEENVSGIKELPDGSKVDLKSKIKELTDEMEYKIENRDNLKAVLPEILSWVEGLDEKEFIDKIIDKYYFFAEADNRRQQNYNAVYKRTADWQEKTEEGRARRNAAARRDAEAAEARDAQETWGHGFYPVPYHILEILTEEGEKKFPNLDWEKIKDEIQYGDQRKLEDLSLYQKEN